MNPGRRSGLREIKVISSRCLLLLLALMLVGHGCKSEPGSDAPAPYASRYKGLPSHTTILRGATVLTGTGERLENTDVLMRNGMIAGVGANLEDDEAVITDVQGMWITPGIIDVHSHLGAFPSPSVNGQVDFNEATEPNTAQLWVEHSVWPQDPGFATALAGGVTTLQILPGSVNLFGGRGITLKNVPGVSVMDMKFPGAPYGLKMACGENPKRAYGVRGVSPSTRMANVAGYRSAWIEAQEYRDSIEATKANRSEAPGRDLKLETLAGVLDGRILVHIHCYRADEMAVMFEVAKEFGYKISAFHHAVEAYKITDLFHDNDTCAALWADHYGFKMEAFDGIRENAAILDRADVCTVIHSDSEFGVQRLNQESAKVIGAAAQVGIEIAPERAIRWISGYAARALGIDEFVGTVVPGKMADIVVWNGNPFSVYSTPARVYIDGALVYHKSDPSIGPVTDFSLGTSSQHGGAL